MPKAAFGPRLFCPGVLTQLLFLNPENQPHFTETSGCEHRALGDLSLASCNSMTSGENFTSLSPSLTTLNWGQ